MLGSLIRNIRKAKKIKRVNLAKDVGVDVGHLAHIERGERIPTHKTLMKICDCLKIPYQPLMYAYDKTYDKERAFCDFDFDLLDHYCYDKVMAVNNIDSLIPCPPDLKTASLAIKMCDDLMAPILPKDSYAFIELNSPVYNKDLGLFCYNNKCYVRQLQIKNNAVFLRSLKKGALDIRVLRTGNFYILGKVILSDIM